MDGLALTLWPPTAWHWLALGLILLSIEMMTGTWDLLWVGLAAMFTSAFARLRTRRNGGLGRAVDLLRDRFRPSCLSPVGRCFGKCAKTLKSTQRSISAWPARSVSAGLWPKTSAEASGKSNSETRSGPPRASTARTLPAAPP